MFSSFWSPLWTQLVYSSSYKASVQMQRLSYLTETVLFNKITRNIIVLSFKDSPWKPFGRRRREGSLEANPDSLCLGSFEKVVIRYAERGGKCITHSFLFLGPMQIANPLLVCFARTRFYILQGRLTAVVSRHLTQVVQSEWSGCRTGKRKKLSSSKAQLGQATYLTDA